MGTFWLGTVPVLAGLGLTAQRAFGPLRRHLPAVTAAALVVIGLLTITGRLSPPQPVRGAPAAHQHDRR
jgi:sulfite exporter TauE/SafE